MSRSVSKTGTDLSGWSTHSVNGHTHRWVAFGPLGSLSGTATSAREAERAALDACAGLRPPKVGWRQRLTSLPMLGRFM